MKKTIFASSLFYVLLLPMLWLRANAAAALTFITKTHPEARESDMPYGFLIAGIFLILLLMALIVLLAYGRRRLLLAKREAEALSGLFRSFIDASDQMISLKDAQLRFVLVNRAAADFFGMASGTFEEGELDDYALFDAKYADSRRQSDRWVLENNAPMTVSTKWAGRMYRTIKFPVIMPDGAVGVGAFIADFTEEMAQKKRLEMSLRGHKILADILTRSFGSMDEQLDYSLREALKLIESQYGYVYLYDEGKSELTLRYWLSDTSPGSGGAAKPRGVYKLDEAGIWGEAVRRREPFFINDFDALSPEERETLKDHIGFNRFLSVPVVIDGGVVAVVTFANKPSAYDEADICELAPLIGGVWNAMERRTAQEKLAFTRNKYLQALTSIGDSVMVVNRNGIVEMLNHAAEALTGWDGHDAVGRHYSEVFRLLGERQGANAADPIAGALETGTEDSIADSLETYKTGRTQESERHLVLLSKTGEKYYLENTASPIRDESGGIIGAVLVFRDVSEKRKRRIEMEYLSFHDLLTGLYNRRFFEEELRRLDAERNLPISIVMCDVNGLKLTNDIFGHFCGDELLKKFADVLKRTCRCDDIIARWGGDEFVVLLPKTTLEEAEQIADRIKSAFSKERIQALRGSASVGAAAKQQSSESITEAMARAEENMYQTKSTERGGIKSEALEAIIQEMHRLSPREKEHSEAVSALCVRMGQLLGLSEIDLRKLKYAGYYHDIGKIALDPALLQAPPCKEHEKTEIKKHPGIGYRILKFFDDTLDLSEFVLNHHECWDGSGYPRGLRSLEIPLQSRILAIAEAYDRHLHNNSPGSEGGREEAALQMILQSAGICFDPGLAGLFARMIRERQPAQ